MKKIFYLATCSTCQKIIAQINDTSDFEMREIKSVGISVKELSDMESRVDHIADLFSKRAMKYRSLGLNEKELSDQDMRDWIVKEYTFLKRPVIMTEQEMFVGNSKKVVEAMVNHVNS